MTDPCSRPDARQGDVEDDVVDVDEQLTQGEGGERDPCQDGWRRRTRERAGEVAGGEDRGALGFQGSQDGRSGATTAFQAVVLSALAFLGVVTFLSCLETSLDDWLFAQRIDGLRAAYAQLVPELAGCCASPRGSLVECPLPKKARRSPRRGTHLAA